MKQNYTMLDNLKLGYGGTQAEMARLINDSGVLGDEITVTAETVNDVSFDKMIEAIHVVQTEMGITGTTAEEAASTIEGSKNAMQASWSNLLTGLADENADLDLLFENLIESVKTFAGNLLPRIEALAENAAEFLSEKLQEYFPGAFEVLTNIVEFATEDILPILQGLADWITDVLLPAIQDAVNWVLENKDPIIAAAAGIAAAFVAWNITSLVGKVMNFVKAIQALSAAEIFAAAKTWLLNTALFANPIGLIIAAIVGLVAAFIVLWKKSDKFRNFWIGLWEKIKKVFSGFIDAWGVGMDVLKDVIAKIGEWFSEAWEKVKSVWGTITDFFAGLWESIKSIFSTIADWIQTYIFQPIVDYFTSVITFFTEAWQIIKELAEGCWEAIKAVWSVVSTWFDDHIITPVKNFFSGMWDGIKNAAESAWDGIKAVWTVVSTWFTDHVINPVKTFFQNGWNGIKDAAKNTWDGIKNIWTVVSTWFSDHVIAPVKNFFSGMWDGIKSKASDAWEGIKSVFGHVADWFQEKFSTAWQKVKDVFSTGGKIFDGIKEGITDAFKNVVNAIIRGINKVIAIPFNAINNTLDKIRDIEIAGISPFSGLISRFTVPEIPELERGGVIKRGQVGLLEGKGDEAVIPLERNKAGLKQIARLIAAEMPQQPSMIKNSGDTVYNFNQTNNSPKALSRWEIYRQTKNLINATKGV